MKRRFKWGDFQVTVTNDGDGVQPWGNGGYAYRYRVTVTKAGDPARYTCQAWGSIHEMEEGRDDGHEGIGAMVLEELCSAACDPEEFWSLAAPKSLADSRAIQRAIAYGEAWGIDSLCSATELARGV